MKMRTVSIRDQTAQNVQSDLDLHCPLTHSVQSGLDLHHPQKLFVSSSVGKELTHLTLCDV